MKVFVPADEAPGYFEIEKDYREWVDAKTRKPLFDATETGIILAEKNIGRHKSGGEKPTGVGKTPLAKWGKTRHRVGKTHTPSGENSYSEASDTIGTRAEERDGEKEHTQGVCESGSAEKAQPANADRHPKDEVERLVERMDGQWPMAHLGHNIRYVANAVKHLRSFDIALDEMTGLTAPRWDWFWGAVKKIDANGGQSTRPRRIAPSERKAPPSASFKGDNVEDDNFEPLQFRPPAQRVVGNAASHAARTARRVNGDSENAS
jgi:hypothetical protein